MGFTENLIFRGDGTKNQNMGRGCPKRVLGQFADLRGFDKKEEGGVFEEVVGVDTPMHTMDNTIMM